MVCPDKPRKSQKFCNIIYGGEIVAIFTLITIMGRTIIQTVLSLFVVVVLVFVVTDRLLVRSNNIFNVEMEKIDYYKRIKTVLKEISDQS